MKGPLSAKVFLRSHVNKLPIPAVFGHSMFDQIQFEKGSSDSGRSNRWMMNHCEKCVVTLSEVQGENGAYVVIGPALPSTDMKVIPLNDNVSWDLPFARPIQNDEMKSTKCPAAYLDEQNYYDNPDSKRVKPYVALGAVGLIVDPQNRVLLTRRAAHMRSFPNAWVMPGGTIDPFESFTDGLIREIREETGLEISASQCTPVGLWESCFPTDGQACIENKSGIKGHYLVIFCKCQILETDDVKISLQEEEIDLAGWISKDQFLRILKSVDESGGKKDFLQVSTTLQNKEVPLQELSGIYPGVNNTGIAQGNLWMLEEFMKGL